jgi:hypothetical protein
MSREEIESKGVISSYPFSPMCNPLPEGAEGGGLSFHILSSPKLRMSKSENIQRNKVF